MHAFPHLLALTAPLFLLVLAGYLLMRGLHWPAAVSDALAQFVFSVAVPALLFRMMSGFSRLPPVDARLLLAYFGGCAIVFAAGRLAAFALFRMDGAAQSVFAIGGVFANTVLLGVPLAQVLLGEPAMPTVSLVVVFNALLLWTLVTASVECARRREMSWRGLARTAGDVVTNPVIGSILAGTLWSYTGLALPGAVDRTLEMVAQAATPLALIALGMGLAEFRARDGLALPALETQAVVMIASLPVGANVYLMAREFSTLEGPVAASLVLSTALAALTTPLVVAVATA